MGKTGGGRGTNQYQVKGRSIAQDGTLSSEATQQAAAFDLDPTWGAPENVVPEEPRSEPLSPCKVCGVATTPSGRGIGVTRPTCTGGRPHTFDSEWGAPENSGAERGDPCDRCGERTGDVQPYGPTGANHWCSTCANERSLEDLKADPEGAARNFVLNATGAYPDDSKKPGKYIETSDGRMFGPFADTAAVEQFVLDNHIRHDLEDFEITDAPTRETSQEYQDYRAGKQARENALVERVRSGEMSQRDLSRMLENGGITLRVYRKALAAADSFSPDK